MGFLERLGLGAPTPEDRARLQHTIDKVRDAEAQLGQSIKERNFSVGKLDLIPQYRERTRLEIAVESAGIRLSGAKDRVAHSDELRRLRSELAGLRGQSLPGTDQNEAIARAELATAQAAYDKVRAELDALNIDITEQEARIRRASGL